MERYKNTWKSLGKSHKNAQLSPQLYHVRSKSFSRILTQQQFSLEDAVVVVVVVVLVVVVVVVRLVVVAVVVVVVVVVHSRATILVFVVIVDSRSTVQQSSFLRRVTTAWIQEIRRRFGPRLHFAAAQQQVREQPEQRNTRRNHESGERKRMNEFYLFLFLSSVYSSVGNKLSGYEYDGPSLRLQANLFRTKMNSFHFNSFISRRQKENQYLKELFTGQPSSYNYNSVIQPDQLLL